MECSVCYGEAGPFQKLCCGHEFCTGCLKTWYLKGTGTGCPMCRRPIYFKGFHAVRDQWDEDAWETRCAEALSSAIDASVEESFEMARIFGDEFKDEILGDLTLDLVDIERTFRALKAEGLVAEDIDYVLNETGIYMSDRHLDRARWIDEPLKEPASRYPIIAKTVTGLKRNRALQDEWCTVNLVVEF